MLRVLGSRHVQVGINKRVESLGDSTETIAQLPNF